MSKAKLKEVGVGQKYLTAFGEDGSSTPWLNDNEELQKRIQENKWKRWDGTEGTVEDHAKWLLDQVRSITSEERAGEFRPYGEKRGCKYYIHDEITKEANGCGFFKLVGELKMEPKDLLVMTFDMKGCCEIDKTIVLQKVLKTYLGKKEGDPFVAAVYWAVEPGFPFYIRDGIDLTSYHKDEDGTVWQIATCLTGGDYFQSMPGALHATNRYWSYKLKSNGDGTTKVTLLCQTVLNGYIPKLLSNLMTCAVLIDYMATMEERVKERKASGEHQKMIEQLELSNV